MVIKYAISTLYMYSTAVNLYMYYTQLYSTVVHVSLTHKMSIFDHFQHMYAVQVHVHYAYKLVQHTAYIETIHWYLTFFISVEIAN